MKKLFFALICVVSLSAVTAHAQDNATKPKDPNAAQFKFVDGDNTYDFGAIPEGPVVEHIFKFKNVGKEPLIINEAHAQCGCTTPEWPKEPILPGKTSSISIKYNTQGRPNAFAKDVFITSNAASDGPTVNLHIKGTVTPAQPPAPGH